MCVISINTINDMIMSIQLLESMSIHILVCVYGNSICLISFDHDNTTIMTIRHNCSEVTEPHLYRMIRVDANRILEVLQLSSKPITITNMSEHKWTLSCGSNLIGVANINDTMTRQINTCVKPCVNAADIEFTTKDLLSYILHSSVCESYTNVTIDDTGHIVLSTHGELLFIRIDVLEPKSLPYRGMSCRVTFKYIRAISHLLQTYDKIFITVHDKKYLRLYTKDLVLDVILCHVW
jgi:hypothetical protein